MHKPSIRVVKIFDLINNYENGLIPREGTEDFISKALLEQKEIIEDRIKIQNLKLDFANNKYRGGQ